MTQEPAARRDTQRLQRAIVDGLEEVKAQNIAVFNTEHLSPLFERVIVASGTSNRQTKALASSVRDAVRDAGFPKPRTEGEENGEWIIVDCGAAVAHIMQPAIRQYYHLEEIWGEKPVRLRLGAPKPATPEPQRDEQRATAGKAARKTAPKASGARAVRGDGARTAPRPAAKAAGTKATAKRASTRRTGTATAKKAATARTPARAPTKRAPARAGPARKAAGKSPRR